jgi:hypothetical protein
VHPAGPELDSEQDVQRAEPDRLDGEEVEGQDAAGLGREELSPRGAAPARGGAETFSAKDRPNRRGGDTDAELQQLAPDPHVAPSWVLFGHSRDELHRLRIERRSARPSAPIRPLATDELPVPSE